jgi:hypothetical protein
VDCEIIQRSLETQYLIVVLVVYLTQVYSSRALINKTRISGIRQEYYYTCTMFADACRIGVRGIPGIPGAVNRYVSSLVPVDHRYGVATQAC